MIDKYQSMRKTDRNRLLEEYARTHPEASLAEIGDIFGITKQRVHELLTIAKRRENKEAATVEE